MSYLQPSGGSAAVPTLIESDETFTVAENTQVLYAMPIVNEGEILAEGYLILVD